MEFRNTRTETVEELIEGKAEADEHQVSEYHDMVFHAFVCLLLCYLVVRVNGSKFEAEFRQTILPSMHAR